MIKMLWIALTCTVLTGCVSTTQIIIKHHFPEEHINYEINQGWTKEYQEKNYETYLAQPDVAVWQHGRDEE